MLDFKEVVKGWKNYLKMFYGVLDEETLNRSKERLRECKGCEFLKNGVCSPCKCPVAPKSMSELSDKNKCYSGKWHNLQ